METPIQVDLGRIAQDLQIRRVQVESVVQLLDEGNTVPFITRYRKERTGNLNELTIREIQSRVGRLRELAERKETILKTIEAQGKLTEELAEAIRAADNPKRLEDLYLPFKPKKKTKASEAREKGLEPLAMRIWNKDETLTDLNAAAAELVNPEKELESPEKVLEGVGYILAEMINELPGVRDVVRRAVWKTGKIVTSKADNVPESQGIDFRDYFQYEEPVNHIPPHRVLAINRGDKEGPLKVKLDVPREELEHALFSQVVLDGHPHAEFFTKSAIDALDRLLLPSLEREVRRDLTEMAERHAVEVFARNLRSLLLQPPISQQTVLAIDPGFRTGCKVAVLDSYGNLLEHGVIHPHQPQNRRHEAKVYLKDLVGKHQIGVVAIGNGTACRETEELVAELIAEGTYFHEHPGDTTMPGHEPPLTGPKPAEGEAKPEEAEAKPPEGEAKPAEAEAEAKPAAEESKPAEAEVKPPEGESKPTEAEAKPPEGEANPANGESKSNESSESMPPIVGGAPDEGEEAADPPGKSPDEVQPPPPPASSTPATESSEAEAQKADQLEKSDQSRNPANEDQSPPVSGGSPDGDQEHPEPTPNPSEAAPAETPIETVPPPAPESPGSVEEQHKQQDAASPGEPSSQSEAPASTEEVRPDNVGAATPETVTPASGEAPAAGEAAQPTSAAESPAPAAPAAEAAGITPAPATAEAPKPPSQKPPKKPKGERPPKVKQPPPPPAPHSADAQIAKLAYVVVNEAGASVYSASPVGREEFPDYDATTRGTISIGRRLQDPLAELVKIEPQNIGVGLYQHDVNPKQLKESLETVIESCVNFVGVDLNTASIPLLRHVSGLNALTARRLVERRAEKGAFTDRAQLLEVEGVGPATYTQAAGFLKIRDGEHPLDRTWVHPESYEAATRFLETLGFSPTSLLDKDQLAALRTKLAEVDIPALAGELNVGEPTLRDIAEALARPDRDPREDLPKPIFKKGVLKLEDLTPGMELKGTVLNVVDFGAFVDIGLKDSGLVHISQLANRYIKSPHDVVSVGDVVTVWVMGVDPERKRVSLTMVEPGTERPRGQAGGGGGGRRGGERRPGRGPRPPKSAGAGAAAQGEAAGGGPQGQAPGRPGARVPGPPSRGGQGPGRGGPRRQGAGAGGSGRFERAQAPRTSRPSKPAPPPPPLPEEALSGNVPLRTFGQLKQLWQARTEDPNPGVKSEKTPSGQSAGDAPKSEPSPASQGPAQQEPSPDPQKSTPQERTETSEPKPETQGPAQQEPNPDPQNSTPQGRTEESGE